MEMKKTNLKDTQICEQHYGILKQILLFLVISDYDIYKYIPIH